MSSPAPEAEALPPYSDEDTTCVKCGHPQAYTHYRLAWSEFNGRLQRRGPLPERLERCCQRCDYRWDEALAADLAETDDRQEPQR